MKTYWSLSQGEKRGTVSSYMVLRIGREWRKACPVRSPLPALQTSGRLMGWHRSTALALSSAVAATVLACRTRVASPPWVSQINSGAHKQTRSRGFPHCVTLEPSYEERGPWWNSFLLPYHGCSRALRSLSLPPSLSLSLSLTLSLLFLAGWVSSQAVTVKKHFHIIFKSWLPFQVCLIFSLIWVFSSEYSTSQLEAVLLKDFRGLVRFLKSLLIVNLLSIFSALPCDPIQWSGSPVPRLNTLPFSSCWCSGGHILSTLGLFTDIGLFALGESLQWTEHSVCGSMKRSLPSPFWSDSNKSP